MLLFGGAIQTAGTVKGRKASRHATSDWMELEKKRGISVTTSVMQFPYGDCIFNLLDTPGHADFSEDTYRTLTAVDSNLMVIDAVKGVEARTIKLMEVCRMRNTPIITFINKLDRESREPLDLLDEIEKVLKLHCVPITWPIGMGKSFKGVYHLLEDKVYLYQPGNNNTLGDVQCLDGLKSPEVISAINDSDLLNQLRDELELIQGAGIDFNKEDFLLGKLTPVFFGSALNNFGVKELLDAFAQYAPAPGVAKTSTREIAATETAFTGFVFKIQANMDKNHRDRIAFLRICSGKYTKGMKLHQVRTQKQVQINNAVTFMAGDRGIVENAYPGDIIGLYNHGTIQIGDAFTNGEALQFMGIPNFAPELFQAVRCRDPLKLKALQKGLTELSQEGATQVFKPLQNNNIILGAVGVLQFDVVAHRLQNEYNVDCIYEPSNISTVRWVSSNNAKKMQEFTNKVAANLAYDGGNALAYIAPSMVNLRLTEERWPDINFSATREH